MKASELFMRALEAEGVGDAAQGLSPSALAVGLFVIISVVLLLMLRKALHEEDLQDEYYQG